MSKRTITELIDDIDGSAATESVRFGLDGVEYEIDVSETNAKQLREALAPFVESGSKVGRSGPRLRLVPPPTRSPADRERMTAIRKWANDNGYEVSDRGRVSSSIIEAYKEAQKSPAPSPAKRTRRKPTVAAFVEPAS